MLKLAFAFVVVLGGVSHAEELSVTAKAPAKQPAIAITFSPLHLVFPMVEITTEVRLADKVGLAGIVGAGSYKDPMLANRIALYEGGASLRYYAAGSFRAGLQLGVEALYVHAATNQSNIDVQAAGLALSPFAGYKWTHSSGLTLEGELGISYMTLRAQADTGQMNGKNALGPLLNLQLGYSF